MRRVFFQFDHEFGGEDRHYGRDRADGNLARDAARQRIDLEARLLKLMEYLASALHQRLADRREEQPVAHTRQHGHAQARVQFRKLLRYGRLRHVELFGDEPDLPETRRGCSSTCARGSRVSLRSN